MDSIYSALSNAVEAANINLNDYDCHVGMGLAGSEVEGAYQEFLTTPHHFKTLQVSSDAHTACLGAHAGEDGGIIIIGTGVVGFKRNLAKSKKFRLGLSA